MYKVAAYDNQGAIHWYKKEEDKPNTWIDNIKEATVFETQQAADCVVMGLYGAVGRGNYTVVPMQPPGYLDHKFKTEVDLLPATTIHKETFCPQKHIRMTTAIQGVAQHDGHPWTDEYIAEQEEMLVEAILNDLRSKLLTAVRQVAPFDGHADFEARAARGEKTVRGEI
jgi:hypothetical protein